VRSFRRYGGRACPFVEGVRCLLLVQGKKGSAAGVLGSDLWRAIIGQLRPRRLCMA
jgi:hypothetical protein